MRERKGLAAVRRQRGTKETMASSKCHRLSSLALSFEIRLTFSREHISGPSSLPSRKGEWERWTEPLEKRDEKKKEKESEESLLRTISERKKVREHDSPDAV